MKPKIILLLSLFIFTSSLCHAQLGVKYDPKIQSTGNLQYWRPKGDLFVGDCMPYYKDGKFSLYWLLDSAHHASLKGLGGHQWALSTTTDLKNWKQEKVVLGIDEEWEKSICTGSIAFYKGKYYAFYATRLINKEGNINEQLSYAISNDGINFDKQKPNPFYTSAPGYSKRDFRDPKVFVDEQTGEFHLLVSSWKENSPLAHAGGALVHLTSTDLKNWAVSEPILTGQGSVPECPDYFFWKGWYYLLYSDNGDTYYVKSRQPYGPWEEPKHQALIENWSNVVKTASFKNDRRIAASWIPSRHENNDNHGEIFGGNLLFRELIQAPDGSLDTQFPEEMIPAAGADLNLKIIAEQYAVAGLGEVAITAPNGVGSARMENVPAQCRITMEIAQGTSLEEYGLYLRADDRAERGYRLNFSPINGTVNLAGDEIKAVAGLDKTIKIDLILKDDIIDLCINNKRCIVNRKPEQKGGGLYFYAKHGSIKFKSVKVMPLLP
ncbi:family 43 glycosylhydrolase [Pedobacter sp. PWIIR3]